MRWNEIIDDEENLSQVLNRISARLQYLAFVASKFQEHVLKCLEEDNEILRSNSPKILQKELKVGRRDFVIFIVEEYERYQKAAVDCYHSSRNEALVYLNGYKDVRDHRVAYEMCWLLRTELEHYAGFYNGKSLNRRVTQIDSKNVGTWFLALPKFQEEMNKLQSLNRDFQVLLELSHLKVFHLNRSVKSGLILFLSRT